MPYLISALLLLHAVLLSAQVESEILVQLEPTFEQRTLSVERLQEDTNKGRGVVQIETLKFYLSQVELYDGDKLVYSEANSYHLIDVEDPESLQFTLRVPEFLSFSTLTFSIGLDSLTNVSGAFGGALDPTNGMYWTWQSGFINFKLEGTADHCPARHHRFQYHIGGYQAPYNTLQKVTLEVLDTDHIRLELAIDRLLETINPKKIYQIMSPNEAAVNFSKLLVSLFTITS